MSEQTMIDAVAAQRALVREIHAVTCDQLSSLDAEDYARLQVLLDTRQALLTRLSRLHFPPDDRERYSASSQDRILTLRGEVERLLKEILVMDQIAREKMESHRDELQTAIREVRRGRQGLAGYRQALEPAPQIVDHAQ
jgi:hypothetical protein